MLSGDVLGVISVYVYVLILVLLSEKILKNYPLFSRKFLHIMVGNIFLLLPIFETRIAMAFFAAAPFIFITYLMSPLSPLDIGSNTSSTGHGLGLVYYSISWTFLAFFFFDHLEIIAVAIVAMSYGDGFASLVGIKYGKMRYNIFGDEKSLEGSITMFLVTSFTVLIVLIYYDSVPSNLLVIPLIVSIATITEGIVPRGLDNLSIAFTTAIFYYAFVYIWVL